MAKFIGAGAREEGVPEFGRRAQESGQAMSRRPLEFFELLLGQFGLL